MSSITWKPYDEQWLGTGLFTKRAYKIIATNFSDTPDSVLFVCGTSTVYLFSEDTLDRAKARLELYEATQQQGKFVS